MMNVASLEINNISRWRTLGKWLKPMPNANTMYVALQIVTAALQILCEPFFTFYF
jgi:hypothetical protein